jgi:hypothetical protein
MDSNTVILAKKYEQNRVIHKLSTARRDFGGTDSFPTCPRSVTMKWGKVGKSGEIS